MTVNVSNTDYLVTAATAAMITSPTNSQLVMLRLTACNNDSVARTLTLYRVGSGGAASSTNRQLKAQSIGAGQTVTLPFSGLTLYGGQSLQAVADSASQIALAASYTVTP